MKLAEELADTNIEDYQRVQWTCDTKAAADEGSEGKLSGCSKAKVLYVKKDGSDAKKCFASQIGSLAVMILAAVF